MNTIPAKLAVLVFMSLCQRGTDWTLSLWYYGQYKYLMSSFNIKTQEVKSCILHFCYTGLYFLPPVVQPLHVPTENKETHCLPPKTVGQLPRLYSFINQRSINVWHKSLLSLADCSRPTLSSFVSLSPPFLIHRRSAHVFKKKTPKQSLKCNSVAPPV